MCWCGNGAEGGEGGNLGQQEAVCVQDGVAAFPQGGLGAEVGNDMDQAVSQPLHSHAVRHALQQAQRVHISPNVVHQLPCTAHRFGRLALCPLHAVLGQPGSGLSLDQVKGKHLGCPIALKAILQVQLEPAALATQMAASQ